MDIKVFVLVFVTMVNCGQIREICYQRMSCRECVSDGNCVYEVVGGYPGQCMERGVFIHVFTTVWIESQCSGYELKEMLMEEHDASHTNEPSKVSDIVHETLDLLSGSGLRDLQSDENEFIRSMETESQKDAMQDNLTVGSRGIKHMPATSRGSTIHEQQKIKIKICLLVGVWLVVYIYHAQRFL